MPLVYMDYTLSCSKKRWALQEISDSGLLAALRNVESLLPVVNTGRAALLWKENLEDFLRSEFLSGLRQ